MPGTSNTRTRLSIVFVAALAIFMGLQSFAGAFPLIGGLHREARPDVDRGSRLLINARSGAILVGAVVDPSKEDSDGDGLTNRTETRRTRTNPRKADTDGDGITDRAEVVKTKTNPRKADTDGDGFNDGVEVAAGSDPRNPASVPASQVPPPPPPPPVPSTPQPPADSTPPDTQVVNGPGSVTQSTVASFSFTATEQGSTFECRLDGGSWSSCSSPKSFSGLSVGAHAFSVRAKDGSGNVDATPATYAWTVEGGLQGPTPQADAIWTKPARAVAASPVTLDGTASTGTAPLTCTWSFENQDGSVVFDTRTGCKIDFTFESTGTKYVALDVHGSDGASDENKQSFAVVEGADTTAPNTTISSSPESTTNSTSASFSFSANESGSTFACQLDGSAWAACTSPKAYSSLALGAHSFGVRATDAAGNTDQSPATWSWTVNNLPDTTAPNTTISSSPAATTTSTSASFSFSANESGSTFACQLDGSAWAACTSPNAYSSLALGAHSFGVRATDAAGNTDQSPATWSWTVQQQEEPPPSSNSCAAGAVKVTTASAVTSNVSSGKSVCVTAPIGDVTFGSGNRTGVIVSTEGSGSMGHIEISGTTGLTVDSARFRSVTIRGGDRTVIENSTIGGTPTNRVSDQLIFMPDTSNDVVIRNNDIAWTVADNSGNTGYGCRCYGTLNGLRFVGNKLHDLAADGFQGVGGDNVLIDRNEIGPVGANPSSSEHTDSIQITFNEANLQITNNWIHNQGYYEGQAVANAGSTYIHGGSDGTLVYENNLVQSNRGRTEICGLGTGGTSRSNITIRRNTWVDGGQSFNSFPGFEWDCDSGSNDTITRNIAVDPDGGLAQDGFASAIVAPNLWGNESLVTLDAQGNCTSSNCNPAGQDPIGYRKPSGVAW